MPQNIEEDNLQKHEKHQECLEIFHMRVKVYLKNVMKIQAQRSMCLTVQC